MPNCENCGNEHTGEYGSGRFCSKGCSKAYSTKANRAEINERVSKTLRIDRKKKCRTCKEEFQAKRKDRVYCSNKCRAKDIKEKTKKKLSERARNNVKNGTHKGWETRRVGSYAQKFFEKVLNCNGIAYEKSREMAFDGPGERVVYFMDFWIESLKINLEIDGKRHGYSARRYDDRERDDALKARGIMVHRVRWKNPRTQEGLDHIRGEIESFLRMYRRIEQWHEGRARRIDDKE